MTTEQAKTALEQMGRMNVLAISGGRVMLDEGTLVLPVGQGYRVEVDYDTVPDAYTVRRVFVRGGKRWVKGEVGYIYAPSLGDVAYRASCYHEDWSEFVEVSL